MIRLSLPLRRSLAALGACTLAALPVAAFADQDAGSLPDATMSEDATATTPDVVQTDTATTPDVGPAQDVTATGGFSSNPCWDEKCAKETAECKASANCVKIHDCKGDQACVKAIADADKAAASLFFAISDCGYKACNDPTKGSCKDICGKFNGDNAPCNCDEACKQYGDCCQDYDVVCATSDSCAGKCGKYDKAAACQCDAECMSNGDCCADFEGECPDVSGGEDGGSTSADASGSCSCAGKECGDDGCGHACGANKGGCPAGLSCNAPTGKCISGTTGGADAAGVGDSGAAKDGGASADATAVVGVPTATKSSGCTAGANGAQGAGLLLALGSLIGALVVRRRFA